jgi:hypothetical protein
MNRYAAIRVLNIHSDAPRSLRESMDYMDPTRSHEAKPSQRMRAAAQERRAVRIAVACLAVVALVAVVAGL